VSDWASSERSNASSPATRTFGAKRRGGRLEEGVRMIRVRDDGPGARDRGSTRPHPSGGGFTITATAPSLSIPKSART
jgi:hypothetical protein